MARQIVSMSEASSYGGAFEYAMFRRHMRGILACGYSLEVKSINVV